VPILFLCDYTDLVRRIHQSEVHLILTGIPRHNVLEKRLKLIAFQLIEGLSHQLVFKAFGSLYVVVKRQRADTSLL